MAKLTEKQELAAKLVGLQLASAASLALSIGMEQGEPATKVRAQLLVMFTEMLTEIVEELGLADG
jgi:hypothetical protein